MRIVIQKSSHIVQIILALALLTLFALLLSECPSLGQTFGPEPAQEFELLYTS